MRDDFLTRDWADNRHHMADGIDRLLSAMRALPAPRGRPRTDTTPSTPAR